MVISLYCMWSKKDSTYLWYVMRGRAYEMKLIKLVVLLWAIKFFSVIEMWKCEEKLLPATRNICLRGGSTSQCFPAALSTQTSSALWALVSLYKVHFLQPV